MTRAKALARDWRAFTVRWKRHKRPNVRIHAYTWRSHAYCHEQGKAHTYVKHLFPDKSGGFKTCSKCGYSYGIGEY